MYSNGTPTTAQRGHTEGRQTNRQRTVDSQGNRDRGRQKVANRRQTDRELYIGMKQGQRVTDRPTDRQL